jgi:hypothetical protein
MDKVVQGTSAVGRGEAHHMELLPLLRQEAAHPRKTLTKKQETPPLEGGTVCVSENCALPLKEVTSEWGQM